MSLKIPQLEPRFLEPPGWRWHYLKNRDNKKLRFGTAYPESRLPSAVVVILPGRAEFAEKYFEVANDLLKQNLSVWILEWQGQGLSDRYIPKYPQRGHSEDFGQHVDDLHEFILEYVKHACVHPDVGRIPMVMLAHSTGANIGLRYIHQHPDMFESAAMTAPLLGIPAASKYPDFAVKLLSLLAGRRYAFAQGDWSAEPDPKHPLFLSSDPIRSTIFNSWLRDNPELRIGGATFGWVRHALVSGKILQKPEILQTIRTPILIALAGKEELIDNEAVRKAAQYLPHARVLELPDSAHEIMMERDEIRNRFMEAFLQLIKETVIDRPESLKTF